MWRKNKLPIIFVEQSSSFCGSFKGRLWKLWRANYCFEVRNCWGYILAWKAWKWAASECRETKGKIVKISGEVRKILDLNWKGWCWAGNMWGRNKRNWR